MNQTVNFKKKKTHLLLHCLVVLSLKLDAIIAQLQTINANSKSKSPGFK